MAFSVLLFQRGAENAREIADILRDEEIAAHEALDGAMQIGVGIAQPFREFRLDVEGQPFFGAPREIVQMTAHRPQKASAF